MTKRKPIPDDPASSAIRDALLEGRLTMAQLADAFGVTERAVRTVVNCHRVPHLKVFRKRYFKIEDFRQAVVKEKNTPGSRAFKVAGRSAWRR